MLKVVPALLIAFAGAESPPEVVELTPRHRSAEVDPAKTGKLVVRFDQPMETGGFSFCGGGPRYPRFAEGKRPRWIDDRTCEVEVALEADRVYQLSLNCPAARNFRSAKGVELVPKEWTFATLPAKVLPPREREKKNRQALDALRKALESKYSYLDLRKLDWPKLYKEHTPAILAARSPRSWASAVGKMLEPTKDLHLYLKVDEDWTVGTGSRRVDPLHRGPLIRQYLAEAERIGSMAAWGRTEDGIGYLMIASWDSKLDLEGVDAALSRLREAKALVVDVRPNAGGDETLARRVAAWFVEGEKVYARHRMRTGPGKSGLAPVQGRSIAGNADEEKRFRGPVAVLIGPYVMSSCESFVLMMEQARDCATVGKPTYGSSGRPLPHELPNGVTIFIPSWQDLLPDGTCFEGVGIAPDVAVEAGPEDFQTRDPILERALAELRKKIER